MQIIQTYALIQFLEKQNVQLCCCKVMNVQCVMSVSIIDLYQQEIIRHEEASLVNTILNHHTPDILINID